MEIFDRLGALVERRWREANYDEAIFPALATDGLSEIAPARHLTSGDVVDWVVDTRVLPPQEDLAARFGEPPITVFANERFHIDVLFWVDGTTSIHSHSFSGAFAVLEGSSIHSRYSFAQRGRFNDCLRWGDLRLEKVELLRAGDVRPIESGSRMIHSVFHLERPTASIVLRTRHEPAAGPQLTYLKPNLAVHKFFTTSRIDRLVQTFRMLHKVESARREELLVRALGGMDALEAFHVLTSQLHAFDDARLSVLVRALRATQPELARLLEPALEETARQHALIARRERVKHADHRFFLALLLNVPARERILELVAAKYADRAPSDTIVSWLAELTQPGSSGESPLGLELDGAGLSVARAMMRRSTFEGVLAELEQEYDADEVAAQAGALRAVYEALGDSMTLRPLFTSESGGEKAVSKLVEAAQ